MTDFDSKQMFFTIWHRKTISISDFSRLIRNVLSLVCEIPMLIMLSECLLFSSVYRCEIVFLFLTVHCATEYVQLE